MEEEPAQQKWKTGRRTGPGEESRSEAYIKLTQSLHKAYKAYINLIQILYKAYGTFVKHI